MKRFKGVLVFVLLFILSFFINSSNSSAEEVLYTDNVIPSMTSNTSPSGEASASSFYTTPDGYKFSAWIAFTNNDYSIHSSWSTENGTTTGWLAYEFPEAKSITKYTIISRIPVADIKELPRDWTFEAWDARIGKWVVLDTRSKVTDWKTGEIKEFIFENHSLYKKYRINITANCGNSNYTVIGKLGMMETISTSTNLTAASGNSYVDLSWENIINAQYYNIKRSKTAGGPYETIATSSAITYKDTGLTNGSTYYYVVSAVVSGTERANSNEASSTPTAVTNPDYLGNYATLVITMTNGGIKEYSLPIVDIDKFITWYDNKSDGTGKSYYTFTKPSNIVPFLRIKEYISFDKISSFEVKEFNQ